MIFHSSVAPCMAQYIADIVHERPIPKNTLTELLPVTFTIDASAHSSWQAAVLEANKSGMEVPRATKVMAVIESSMPTTHPKSSAKSITQHVSPPMTAKDIMKHGQPPAKFDGGTTTAIGAFQGTLAMCIAQSSVEGVSSSSSTTCVTEATISSRQVLTDNRQESIFTTPSNQRLARTVAEKRAKSSFSLWIVTVSTQLVSPPSVRESNSPSPSASSKITWNISLCSPNRLGNKVTGTNARASPGPNTSSPSAATKSYPGTAVRPSRRYLQDTVPAVLCLRSTGMATSLASSPLATSQVSAGKAMTPPEGRLASLFGEKSISETSEGKLLLLRPTKRPWNIA
mmetsp:Transcript_57565/g.175359  ORF Transcript_57565/g.175359 Transcript_57565/m.175359 type:complete len:342 (-) Transcript_57565:678-1703(-)